jgi:hypothetical protein
MGTRVKVTYIAMDHDGNKPIMSASTFEDLRAGLDDYYGCDNRGGKCLGFTPYVSKYPDEYEGYYQYEVSMIHSGRDQEPTEYVDTVKVYCIDYYPHTIYETTPQTNNII